MKGVPATRTLSKVEDSTFIMNLDVVLVIQDLRTNPIESLFDSQIFLWQLDKNKVVSVTQDITNPEKGILILTGIEK